MESLKAKNCNRGQLFRTCWVSSARCSKLYEVFNWSTEIYILIKCRPWTAVSPLLFDLLDFSYFPLSRVLHVTLANWQRFGFETISLIFTPDDESSPFHIGVPPGFEHPPSKAVLQSLGACQVSYSGEVNGITMLSL